MANYDISYIFKAIDKFSPAMKDMKDAIVKFEEKLNKADDKLGKFSQSTVNFGRNISRYVLAPMAAIGAYAIKNAEQLKGMEVRLRAMSGSAVNAARIMESSKFEARKTGFGVKEITDTAGFLASRGFSPEVIKKRISEFSTLALGTGEEFSAVGEKFARWTSSGFAGGRELRRVPVIMNELRKMATEKGWSEAMFRKAMMGKVGVDLLYGALDRLTKKDSEFYKSSEIARGMMDVSLKRIHESIRQMAGAYGEAIIESTGLDKKLMNLSETMDKLEPKFKEWLKSHPDMVKMSLAAAGIAAGLVGIATAARIAAFTVGGLQLAFAGLSSIATPFLLLAAPFIKAVLAVQNVRENMPTMAGLKQTWNALQSGELSAGQLLAGLGAGQERVVQAADIGDVGLMRSVFGVSNGNNASNVDNNLTVNLNGVGVFKSPIQSNSWHDVNVGQYLGASY